MANAQRGREEKARALAKLEERKRVALRVFQECDEAGVRTLARLAIKGRAPSCTAGCSHCCSLEVPMSRAEGEVIVDWINANRTQDDIDLIRERLRGWLDWYRTSLPRLVAAGMSRTEAFFRHAPRCALLVDGQCSAYPVRPVTCRNHYVSSPPTECDPATSTREPYEMLDIPRAAQPYVVELRRVVERHGGDYLASIHIIGEWLAHLLDVEREPWRG